MESILKSKRISETPFRAEVLSVFSTFDHAVSISGIEKNLKKHDRVTLYRTIKLFKEVGIIHEIALSGEPSKFALCKDACKTDLHQHKHIHFKCTNCLTVSCVDIDAFPKIKLPGHQIVQLEIQATGLCDKCS